METNNDPNIAFFQLKDILTITVTIFFSSSLLLIPTCFSNVAANKQSASPVSFIQPAPVYRVTALEVNSHGENKELESSDASPATTAKPIPFDKIINRVAGRYQVDPHLIRAIIFAESGYNPKAKSKKGALGLMQLMPSTAESLGVTDLYDPEENIDGGVRYFKTLLDRFDDDVQLALAAYNAGSRHVRNYEGVPPFRATQLYIKKVLKFQEKFKAEMQADARKVV